MNILFNRRDMATGKIPVADLIPSKNSQMLISISRILNKIGINISLGLGNRP
jgi:hypothetical protein